jgi:fructose-1,6-bisphosphatase-3
MNPYEIKYLKQLAKEFPTVQQVSTEIINLNAILNLPKGTEHFLSDIHGEYDTFNHFIKNGSGVIRDKISLYFSKLTQAEQNQLAFFAYYPKQMIKKYEELLDKETFSSFIREKLLQLIRLSKKLSQKYTKSKIGKSLPTEFSYIISELLFESSHIEDKTRYYSAILDAIFKTKRERNFLIELSRFIQRLTIDRLHIVGDIFDRGPSAHLVLNKMMKYHSLDIEWGNHDVLWMGAASGSEVCICNVLRNSSKYNTLDTLEEGYGINLLPLAQLAIKYYKDDDCTVFYPKATSTIDQDKQQLVAKIHKAISIIQFKMEYSLFQRNPNFLLSNQNYLHLIDYENNTITWNGKTYPLKDSNFPTINPLNPYTLNDDEHAVIKQLKNSFLNNDLLQRHINFLVQQGQMFLRYNHNLLFHGCIPLKKDGSFSTMKIDGQSYSGKSLFIALDKKVRSAYLKRYDKTNPDKDYFVFLWQGENSPLFGKKYMKTFQRYFIEDKTTHLEEMNNYFILREQEAVLRSIYSEFNLDWNRSKIINGHVPTDITVGDNPVKANGKIYAIDGGMSKQYKEKIGIGGYTLIVDSYKIFLISHERFPSVDQLIKDESDIISLVQSEDVLLEREYIYDTDKGDYLKSEISDLYKLLHAYWEGIIKEQPKK